MKSRIIKIIVSIVAVTVIALLIAGTVLTINARKLPQDAPDRASEGILPSDEQIAAAIKYDRVLIIGVDGAGGYFGNMETPNFDKMFPADKSSITYTGLSQYPTVSAQNWGSMLHGVRYQKHFLNNDIVEKYPYTYFKYPSVFKAYAKNHKKAKFLTSCTWTPINKGIVENMISIKKRHAVGSYPTTEGYDKSTCEEYIKALSDRDPAIGFLQFDQVDHAGHSAGAPGTGYGDAEFQKAISNVDELIGMLYKAYEEKGWIDSTMFLLVSDHGHKLEGGGHGGETIEEKNVTLAVWGAKGNIIPGTPGKYVTQDLAAIVMYGLGEKQPESWEARVPYNIFTTLV